MFVPVGGDSVGLVCAGCDCGVGALDCIAMHHGGRVLALLAGFAVLPALTLATNWHGMYGCETHMWRCWGGVDGQRCLANVLRAHSHIYIHME